MSSRKLQYSFGTLSTSTPRASKWCHKMFLYKINETEPKMIRFQPKHTLNKF